MPPTRDTTPGAKYALTVSPEIRWAQMPFEDQFIIQRRMIATTLDKLGTSYVMEAQFYPNRPDIHWHGWIEMPKAKTRYYKALSALRKDIGFICPKLLFDAQGWLEYCRRDRGIMNECLGFTPVFDEKHPAYVKPEITYKPKTVPTPKMVKAPDISKFLDISSDHDTPTLPKKPDLKVHQCRRVKPGICCSETDNSDSFCSNSCCNIL